MLLLYLTSTETADITKSLKINNSHGYDEIPTRILKLSIYHISTPPTYVRIRTLSSGILPTRLKFSEVRPVFKKGDKPNTSDYRPVSLLASFSAGCLYQHMNNNQIAVMNNLVLGMRHQRTLRCIS
jgi:hypothetical protein